MTVHEQADDLVRTRELLGSQLKSARQQKTLSIAEIASRLMLDQRVIEGLEAGDYSGLPETTFVRGYLQAYLRLLGKPESLLAEFDAANQCEYPIVLTETSAMRSASSGDAWVRFTSIGLAVLLLVAVGLWISEQSLQAPDDMVADSRFVTTADEDAQTVDAGVASGAPAAVGQADEAQHTTAQQDGAADSAQSSPRADEAESVVAQKKPDNELILRFSGSSWIRIMDGDGVKLAAGTYENGQELALRGVLPYSVILGNSAAVKIQFLGKEIGESFKPGKVARFTLGKNGLQYQ